MNNSHIIIGYGNWAKKIITFLKEKKFYSKIYIKTRYMCFEYGKNENIEKKNFIKIKKKIKSAHICTPVNSHFYYLNKYVDLKRIIVEKPFLKNLYQLKKIQKIYSSKNLLIVHYTYLFNPIINKLKKKINIKSNDNLNFSEYLIEYKSKSNKVIEKIEKVENLKKIIDEKKNKKININPKKKIFKKRKYKKKFDLKKN